MAWTVTKVREEFGEDVLRDICRDINDLMCARAGHGQEPNRIGVPEETWASLLRAGGYNEQGVRKAIEGRPLLQEDTEGPFTPYTILTLENVTSDRGGPLTTEELDIVLTCALRYRQLIQG